MQQIRPRVFLFISLVLMLAAPMLRNFLQPEWDDPNAIKIVDPDAPSPGYLAKAYDVISPEWLFSVGLASVVGVAGYHIVASLAGRLLLVRPKRRELLINALFYVAGAQFILMTIAYIIQQLIDPFGRWPTIGPSIFEADNRPWDNATFMEGLYASSVAALVLPWLAALAAAAAPYPVATGFSRRSWRWRKPGIARTRWAIRQSIWIMILVAFSAVAAIAAFWGATYVHNNTAPGEKPLYQMQIVKCVANGLAPGSELTATILMTNSTERPYLVDDSQFDISVSAMRVDGDPPQRVSHEGRVGTNVQDAVTSELDTGRELFVLDKGRSALVRVNAMLADRAAFLTAHPDDQACIVWDAHGELIGARTYLEVEEPPALSEPAFAPAPAH